MSIRNIESIRINQLRVIKTLMSTRSVSETAAQMSLTQSAISKTLSMLRSAFDDEIFIKTNEGMEPTSLGKSIAVEVEEILTSIQRIESIANQFDIATATDTLAISCNDFFQNVLIINLVPRIRAAAPNLSIQFYPHSRSRNFELLVSGEVSFQITEIQSRSENIETEMIAKDELVLAMSKSHKLARKRSLTVTDLANAEHVLVATESKTNRELANALHEHGKTLNCPMTLSSFAPLAPLLSRGQHVAVIPLHFTYLYGQFIPMVAKTLPFQLTPVSMLVNWHRRNHQDPLTVWVLEQLRDTFKKWR